jgi:hypothetical protein
MCLGARRTRVVLRRCRASRAHGCCSTIGNQEEVMSLARSGLFVLAIAAGSLYGCKKKNTDQANTPPTTTTTTTDAGMATDPPATGTTPTDPSAGGTDSTMDGGTGMGTTPGDAGTGDGGMGTGSGTGAGTGATDAGGPR